MRVGFVAGVLTLFLALLAVPVMADPVRGSGSTFAFPIIARWAEAYDIDKAGGGDFVAQEGVLDYEPIGSLGGILRLAQREVDFAATDAPLPPEELAKLGYVQFPIVMGGIVAAVNIDGIAPGKLRLNGPILADIYLGKIQNWSDPAIKAINPELVLPDLKITPVHRKDGSGSTFNWTSYLSAVSPEWEEKYGADTLISWPLGMDADGGSRMAGAVKETRGAIGYLEYGQMARAGLDHALVQNRAGSFITPEPKSFQAAAAQADWAGAKDFHLLLVDAAGADSYPIAAVTFAVMPATPRSQARLNQTLWFLGFALDKGQADAAALGYVPLPEALVKQVKAYWADKFKFAT